MEELATLLEGADIKNQNLHRAIFQQFLILLWCFKAVKIDKYESLIVFSVSTIDGEKKKGQLTSILVKKHAKKFAKNAV